MSGPKVDRRLVFAAIWLVLAVVYWLPTVVVEIGFTVFSIAAAACLVCWSWRDKRRS